MKITQILEREIVTAMRLLGVSSVHDLKPEMVCLFICLELVMVYNYVFVQVERVDWQPLPRVRL